MTPRPELRRLTRLAQSLARVEQRHREADRARELLASAAEILSATAGTIAAGRVPRVSVDDLLATLDRMRLPIAVQRVRRTDAMMWAKAALAALNSRVATATARVAQLELGCQRAAVTFAEAALVTLRADNPIAAQFAADAAARGIQFAGDPPGGSAGHLVSWLLHEPPFHDIEEHNHA